jgi:hypothetical protein
VNFELKVSAKRVARVMLHKKVHDVELAFRPAVPTDCSIISTLQKMPQRQVTDCTRIDHRALKKCAEELTKSGRGGLGQAVQQAVQIRPEKT